MTGISTGALIAPFAFLGPDYDPVLRRSYTQIGPDDIYETRGVFKILGSDSVASSAPLRRLIATVIDQEVFDAVAREHARGRRLFIGTTNLDAQRPVVWDMGAIAASGHPKALELFRSVLLASASIPIAFPPVYVEVTANGESYDEMHVDGGVTQQLFFHGQLFDVSAVRRDLDIPDAAPPRLYVIRNAAVDPTWSTVEPSLLPIAGKTVATLIKSQASGDLNDTYAACERDGIEFRLAHIPEGVDPGDAEEFDTERMNRLFELAFELAREGYRWRRMPPGIVVKTAP